MSDEDALLAAIAAHPDEDTPRLAYADWLDEHDRHIRAEFIRVQIEIARVETLPRVILNRHVDVFKRNQELIDNHRDELLGPLAALPAETRIEFRRGFAFSLELRVDRFVEHAAVLAAARPRLSVRVREVTARVYDFVNCPHLECVTEVRAYSEAFASFPGVVWPGDDALRTAAARLSRLEILDLEGCGLGNLHTALVAASFSLSALADLDLSANDLTDAAVANLLDSGLPRQLKRLILGGNPIGNAGAIALAEQWPTGDADRLEYLNLKFTNIGPPGQQALLARFGGRVDLF
jgi:uncharacterized protein (TIGR02996 family)